MARPRGFIYNWNPTERTSKLIGQVLEILDENSDILPLTLRQIFYMLVSNYGFAKTERDYKRLCETMNKARRARHVSMHKIRDDGLRRNTPSSWDDEAELVDTFLSAAESFRLNRQAGQDRHIMVWCEAGGMLPQLASAVDKYGVTVLSSGGFDSVTTKHNFAREVSIIGSVEILHIGDHDPSGVHMCSSLDEDLQAFVGHYGGEIEVTRLAVTPDQVADMDLTTSPPKPTDRRAFEGETTQAEAIPPRVLRQLVRDAVETRMNMSTFDEVLEEEKEVRESLAVRLASL